MSNKYLKFRISIGHTVAIGPGKAELLESIATCGSISSAAKKMNMSYRRAWELVDVMNKSFKQPLVTTSPGGSHGGGAQLTEFGLFILNNYHLMVKKANLAAKEEINQITSQLNIPN